jgi:hypothetical protein
MVRILIALLLLCLPARADSGPQGLIVQEWRIASDAPPWLRQAALRGATLWGKAHPGFKRRFRTVSPAMANIGIGPTPPEFMAVTYISPEFHPYLMVNETDVAHLASHRREAFALLLHEMGHALCGCDAHLFDTSAGVMAFELADDVPHFPTKRDVELLRKAMQ